MTTKKATSKKKAVASKKSVKKMPAKKAVKKATPKKASPKKASATKKPAKQTRANKNATLVLVCAPPDNCFWTKDGQILQDLAELERAFADMEEAVFQHHVTKQKNDFADWVEHVLQDAVCAEALRKSRKSNSARTVVVRRLRLYSV